MPVPPPAAARAARRPWPRSRSRGADGRAAGARPWRAETRCSSRPPWQQAGGEGDEQARTGPLRLEPGALERRRQRDFEAGAVAEGGANAAAGRGEMLRTDGGKDPILVADPGRVEEE